MGVQLGRTQIQLSRVALGCMWPARLTEPEIQRLVHAAYDRGVTSFDTAPLYGFHSSEQILGRALRDRRHKVQILSKAGLSWHGTHGSTLFQFTDAAGVLRSVRKDSRPLSLRAEVEASLKRLETDAIDLLQIHHPDVDTPLADSLAELAALERAGKIRAIGVSNVSPEQLRTCLAALGAQGTHLAALQCEYSLLQRFPERALLPLCRSHEVSLLAYAPLGRGLLADRRRPPESGQQALARLLIDPCVASTIEPIAARHQVAVSQVALAWLLAQPGVTTAIAGASSAQQAVHNAEAQTLRLAPEELAALRAQFTRLDVPLRVLDRGLRLPGVARAARIAQKLVGRLR